MGYHVKNIEGPVVNNSNGPLDWCSTCVMEEVCKYRETFCNTANSLYETVNKMVTESGAPITFSYDCKYRMGKQSEKVYRDE